MTLAIESKLQQYIKDNAKSAFSIDLRRHSFTGVIYVFLEMLKVYPEGYLN